MRTVEKTTDKIDSKRAAAWQEFDSALRDVCTDLSSIPKVLANGIGADVQTAVKEFSVAETAQRFPKLSLGVTCIGGYVLGRIVFDSKRTDPLPENTQPKASITEPGSASKKQRSLIKQSSSNFLERLASEVGDMALIAGKHLLGDIFARTVGSFAVNPTPENCVKADGKSERSLGWVHQNFRSGESVGDPDHGGELARASKIGELSSPNASVQ